MNEEKKRSCNGKNKTRILVVDDHPIVREGLTQLINHEPDLEVYAEAENADQAIKAVKEQQVDLALIDMLLKNTTGTQVTKELKLIYPNLLVLIFSMSDEPLYVRHAFEAGAAGYITKDEMSEKIISAIHRVLKGKIYLSEKLSQKFSKSEFDRLVTNNSRKSFS